MNDLKYQMRLQPPFVIDGATGKKLHDYVDEHGDGQFVTRKWYANFRWEGKHIGNSLNAYQPDWRSAIDNLVLLKQDLKKGRVPNGTRIKIKNLKSEISIASIPVQTMIQNALLKLCPFPM